MFPSFPGSSCVPPTASHCCLQIYLQPHIWLTSCFILKLLVFFYAFTFPVRPFQILVIVLILFTCSSGLPPLVSTLLQNIMFIVSDYCIF